MNAVDIREGDIVEIDYIAEFTKEHINEGKACVIWKGFNNQPLVRKLDTKTTIWTCYEHIAKVVGHVDIEGYIDKALSAEEIETQECEEAHRWIPCEKRLPDKLQDVLVTFYDAEGEYDIAYMRKTFNASYKAQGIENEWVSSMGETTYADYEVVAWKPIEPYTAESEGA